ncbi:MAG: hypothetical protein COY58_01910 [Gammaproteobacteria bacterium CG_4_10_14_0_8_um_filter_38_16]|nr:MAG: hypothetical protein COY58_01910 [Gammaproteobacteria bacterium CG_4_10_14_0_8_um_filter_38_16]PJA04070.1 MAG: hypothetical protein COX72_01695 [Gammaproteobacteria bacterium CG_4_10_14_0_2_um_filter_38_22]PJB10978.1 MAG: hypothetical protein CO120_01990 [Gammaproteobacteria bacterium CG_4_9_14_3_um_filter_38_9]
MKYLRICFSHKKFFLLIIAIILALNIPVCVFADSPPVQFGFYAGGSLGYGSLQSGWGYTNANYFNTIVPDFFELGDPIIVSRNFSIRSNGFLFAGNLGYNFYKKHSLFGLESDFLNTNFKKQITNYIPLLPDSSPQITSSVYFIFLLNPQIGYNYKRFTAFLDGGYAGANTHLKLSESDANTVAQSTKWANGWSVGAKINYQLSSHFSLGLVYHYIKLYITNQKTTCPQCIAGTSGRAPIVDGKIKIQTVLVGFDYYFTGRK